MYILRKVLSDMNPVEAMELLDQPHGADEDATPSS